jgi:ABC-2 type transport system permease protein
MSEDSKLPFTVHSSLLTRLRPAFTIARRDLSLSFNAPATYVVAVLFLFLTGWLFASPLFQFGQSTLDTFLRPLPLIFTFLIPALTMRSFAEEFREGTIEYLSTLPLRDWQIVLGKFLASLGLIATLLGFTLVYPALLFIAGQPDPGQMIGTYFSILGLTCFFTAISLWASALTRNQVVAFIVGFFVCFVFFLFDRFAALLPPAAAGFLSALGIEGHFDSLARGVLDTRDLLYWLSGTVFFLTACLTTVESRRTR